VRYSGRGLTQESRAPCDLGASVAFYAALAPLTARTAFGLVAPSGPLIQSRGDLVNSPINRRCLRELALKAVDLLF
jgi:hypothetical protein